MSSGRKDVRTRRVTYAVTRRGAVEALIVPVDAGERLLTVSQPDRAWDAWEALGGFDEAFRPLWFEDVDFCRRLRNMEFSVRYEPGAVALHRGGHSIRKLGGECRNIYWYASLLMYASKHYHPVTRGAVCMSVGAGAILRAVAGVWTERSLKPASVFGRVLGMALACLVSSRALGK